MYLSIVGLFVGTAFFAFSLAPSLLPRPYFIQGVLAGLPFSVGYGLGVGTVALWNSLQLPVWHMRIAIAIKSIAALLCLFVAVSFLWQATNWQNASRDDGHVGVSRPATLDARPDRGVGVRGPAGARALVPLGVSVQLRRFVPPRISRLVGIVAAVALFWSVIDGVLLSGLLRVADRSVEGRHPAPTPVVGGHSAFKPHMVHAGVEGIDNVLSHHLGEAVR